MSDPVRVRPKDRDAILQSIRAGVVPRTGLHHIQVGRAQEIQSLMKDLESVSDGGSSIRFVIGDYGAGKTFFLHLIRTVAFEKGFVTAHADLTPDRRIHATGGQSRNLYAELMRNLATRTKPEGGALAAVVERFVTSALTEAREQSKPVESVIQDRLQQLSEMVGGYDFAQVISLYWKGHDSGNDQLKSDAVRWLRAEFSTKTDARNALGVRTIIDDANIYDQLKLMARFVRLSGYAGFLVGLDELVNLYKMANTQARNANYEQILRILNDCLQGVAVGLGIVLCGTPDFLMDTRRGLFSYQALQSRLAENTFANAAGVQDFTGPVIRLASLTQEDLYVLLMKLRLVYATSDPAKFLVPDEALKAFMDHCSKKIGDAYFRTPRNTIRAFIDLLAVLEQNGQLSWQNLIESVNVDADTGAEQLSGLDDEIPDVLPTLGSVPKESGNDELSKFQL
ncbi:MAG: ATP-binding protein [Bacteroidetes bacterium]|nr:ATP-binding protein [Bacteroidota bacterium]MCW5896718.1 ATP-binding protein [Bacteroidota bacterium]